MPTGYTAAVQSGEVTELKDYILKCARNFGACMHMRDDPLNKSLQHRQPSDYHLKQLEKANEELKKYQQITDEEIQTAIDEYIIRENKYREDYINTKKKDKIKYEVMLEKVNAWQPPTKNHIKLKEFAIEQLESSIKFDCQVSAYEYEVIDIPTVDEYRSIRIEGALKDIKYHTKRYQEELKRCREVNTWIDNLIESLN